MTNLVVYTDGGARGNPGPAGYGAAVCDGRSEEILVEAAGFYDSATNNVAEYSGLILGLETVARLFPGANVRIKADSNLMVNQMSGRWKIKDPTLAQLAAKASQITPLGHISFEWVPRAKNKDADRLANEAMDKRGDVYRDLRESAGRDEYQAQGETPDVCDDVSSRQTEVCGAGTESEQRLVITCDNTCQPQLDDVGEALTWLEETCARNAQDVVLPAADIYCIIAAIGGFRRVQVAAAFEIAGMSTTLITCRDGLYTIRNVGVRHT